MGDAFELGQDVGLGRIGERIPASEVLRHPPERLPRHGILSLAADEAADELVDRLKPVLWPDAPIDDTEAVPDTVQMIDSTIVRAHHHAAGAKGGLTIRVLGARKVALRPKFIFAPMLEACL